MGIPEPADPDRGPALPDMPPYLPVGTLAARLADLFRQAQRLAMPWVAHVDESDQSISLEFGTDQQSAADIVAWATRFGGVLQSHQCHAFSEETWHVQCTFEFSGAAVMAYAFIPAHSGQEDDLNDNRY